MHIERICQTSFIILYSLHIQLYRYNNKVHIVYRERVQLRPSYV